MTSDEKANVIREMICHEDELLLGRTNWLLTIEGLLIASLALAWDKPWIPFVIIAVGALFSSLFIPYLYLSEKAIKRQQDWFENNCRDYDGPEIIGLPYSSLRGWKKLMLPWRYLPYVFLGAWLVFLLVRLAELNLI